MDKKILAYLTLSHFLGIGPLRFQKLQAHLGGVLDICKAPENQLKELLGDRLGENFDKFRKEFNPQEKLEEIKRKEIEIIPFESEKYPKRLKEISDPPICLYIKGSIDLFDFERDLLISIVGTRKPTSYGQQITKKFSRELSNSGVVIVSGMAMGIDTVAHQSSIEAGGRTIAVLGCGVDIIYPPINKKLYELIIAKSGIVVSEFPPGQTVLPGLFIARNRIISGLSQGVLVIEGAKNSGSLITARYAAEQGRDAFAPPSPITSEMSQAPNILLKQGAKLVTETQDILEEYDIKFKNSKNKVQELLINDEEKTIYNLLQKEAYSSDELSLELKRPVDKIINILSLLEIKGIIEKDSQGKYVIINV